MLKAYANTAYSLPIFAESKPLFHGIGNLLTNCPPPLQFKSDAEGGVHNPQLKISGAVRIAMFQTVVVNLRQKVKKNIQLNGRGFLRLSILYVVLNGSRIQ